MKSALQHLENLYFTFLIGLGFVFIAISQLPSQVNADGPPGLVTADGHYLIRNSAPFEVKGMNYYPKDDAWDRFWFYYPTIALTINRELDEAKALGVNTVRIFLPYRYFSETVFSDYPGYLVDFTNRLQARDMVAIVTLFDFYPSDSADPYEAGDYPASKQHISTVINTLGVTNTVVMAWDIKNELDRDYDAFGKAKVKAWATEMLSHTRQLDPNHLVTLGFYGVVPGTLCYDSSVSGLAYDPAIAAEFAPLVDFVSMHYFLSERCFESDLQALQALIGNKPLVLEEFGLHSLANPAIPCSSHPGNLLCDDPHTEIEQAAYYNALLSVSEAYDISGYVFWTLNDLSYILPNTQESHHCQGILRNSQVNMCEVSNPTDYGRKPVAETVPRHFERLFRYLDLFDGWTDSNTDEPPAGWSDNFQQGGALLRGFNPSNPLWSHTPGHVAFSKVVKGTSPVTGLATSPLLMNVDMDRYPLLTGHITGYSIRDAINGSNSTLFIGVREGSQITRLLTVTRDTTLPLTFSLDLRQAPLNWTGTHTFQIVFELVPQDGTNGYSATYEFDWIAIQDITLLYLPLIVK